MPSGHVLLAADASPTLGTFHPPTQLFDFDPLATRSRPSRPPFPIRTWMLIRPISPAC